MLTDLHNAITTQLALDMPTLGTCAAYPDLKGRVTLPAVLVEMPEFYPAADPGTEQLALTASCRALCIYDPKSPNAYLEVRNMAVTVAYNVFMASRFGQPVGPAQVQRVGEDAFEPELDGYFVMAVEWTHEIRLGASVWDGAGTPVTSVSASSLGGAQAPLV